MCTLVGCLHLTGQAKCCLATPSSLPSSHPRVTRSATLPSFHPTPPATSDLLPPKEPLDLRELVLFVREHFKHVVDAICTHFNDHDLDFTQRVWLCYERLFFETFSSNFISLYQVRV